MSEYLNLKRDCSAAYLRHIRSLDSVVGSYQELIDNYDSLPAVRYDIEKVAGSGWQDRAADLLQRKEQLLENFASSQRLALDEIEEAHRAITKIRAEWAAVLEYHYIAGKQLKDVAKTMNYSYRWVMEAHKQGLVALYPYIPPEWKIPYHNALDND